MNNNMNNKEQAATITNACLGGNISFIILGIVTVMNIEKYGIALPNIGNAYAIA